MNEADNMEFADKATGKSGPKPENPFNQYFGKFMQATKITTTPMQKGEAIKVLNLKQTEQLDPNEIMEVMINLPSSRLTQ